MTVIKTIYSYTDFERFFVRYKVETVSVGISLRKFYGCIHLSSVVLGNSVTKIGMFAFEGCDSLKEIHNHRRSPQSVDENIFPKSIMASCTLFVPIGSSDLYKASRVWNQFSIIEEQT